MNNRPDPRSNMTQQQLDAAAALVASNNFFFVSSMRMRLAQVRNPMKPDLPVRLVELHLTMQDRDEKAIWLMDKPVTQQLAQVLNDLLDEEKGFWSESFVLEEETTQPSPQDLIQAAQEINPGTHDSMMVDGESVPVAMPDPIELAGTLPMGINRPEDAGDGEFDYLKGADAEHQHE